ncbi:MAG: hypothetical protein KA408_12875 [Flavobacteriales bacterium]|nr:hypothetical protein [Flavobacteriales bacterium]
MRAALVGLTALLSAGYCHAQEWTLFKTISLAESSFEIFDEQANRLVLFEGKLVYTANGSIYVHGRDWGGVGQWELDQVIPPEQVQGTSIMRIYGKSLVVHNGGVYVESSDGTWKFNFGPTGLVRDYRLDNMNARVMAATDSFLCIASSTNVRWLVQCWDADQVGEMAEPRWAWTKYWAPNQSDGSIGNLAMDRNRLIIPDVNRPFTLAGGGVDGSGLYNVYEFGNDTTELVGSSGNNLPFLRDFGRAVAWKGDTVFAAFSNGMVEQHTGIDVRVLQDNGLSDSIARIMPGSAGLVHTLLTKDSLLYVGTDRGFTKYSEVDGEWQLTHSYEIGGDVACMAIDDDILAVAKHRYSGDTIYLYRRMPTGISEKNTNASFGQLSIAPNPATTQVRVDLKGFSIDQLILYDATGRILRHIALNGRPSQVIERATSTSGVQFVRGLDHLGRTVATGNIVWGDDN